MPCYGTPGETGGNNGRSPFDQLSTVARSNAPAPLEPPCDAIPAKAGSVNPKSPEEVPMAVKALIKRVVPEKKAREMIPLFRQMRALAMNQDGYISGETLRNLNNPEEFLVISSWQSSNEWIKWLNSPQRQEIQEKIDALLGGQTKYEIYHYGFSE
jgi:heme-degrading monooxygenase HmoA